MKRPTVTDGHSPYWLHYTAILYLIHLVLNTAHTLNPGQIVDILEGGTYPLILFSCLLQLLGCLFTDNFLVVRQ